MREVILHRTGDGFAITVKLSDTESTVKLSDSEVAELLDYLESWLRKDPSAGTDRPEKEL